MSSKCTIKSDRNYSDDYRRLVCKELPVNYIYDGKNYCVLHYPDENKHNTTNFNEIIKTRLENRENSFQSVYFSLCNEFSNRIIEGNINFSSATFFDEAQFSRTTFEGEANFYKTTFEWGANFDKAVFKKHLRFDYSTIKNGCFFREAEFCAKVNFNKAIFDTTCFFNKSEFLQSVYFSQSQFLKYLYFDDAIFHENVEFAICLFNQYAYFSNTKFIDGANFVDSTFNDKAFFYRSKFENSVDFAKVRFGENSQIDFHETIFRDKVYFNKAIVEGYLEFLGNKFHPIFDGKNVLLKLKQARVEKAKRISFTHTTLNPLWFIDVNSKDFIFLDVDWMYADGTSQKTNLSLQKLNDLKISGRPHRLLNITCSQLATNYEESKQFEQASNFRRMSMQLLFWEKWLSLKVWLLHPIMLFLVKGELGLRKYKLPKNKIYERWKEKNKIPYSFWQSFDIPHYLYRISSFYGESWERAIIILLFLILIVFPFIYTKTNFYVCPIEKSNSNYISVCETRTLTFSEGMRQSLATATLQNVETRKPNSPASETFTILEKIFAPLQAALLALAIRRKFMR